MFLDPFVDLQVHLWARKKEIMETVLDTWHPSWRDLPWKAWTSPVERFEVLPSFVVGEFFFITAAILLLIHAAQHVRKESFFKNFVYIFSVH